MHCREIVVVDSVLSFRQRRLQAARSVEMGVEILTLPQLASRCAGGFLHPIETETLYDCIAEALALGEFEALEAVAPLPGMARAVASTLDRLWRADFDIESVAGASPRFRDLAVIEARILARLPEGQRTLPRLRDAALARLGGPLPFVKQVTIEGLLRVDPVWRPLLSKLAQAMPVVWWHAAPLRDAEWFQGELEYRPRRAPIVLRGELCADPHAEIVEALRWARALLSTGTVHAAEIGIATAAPAEWDDHMLVLATDAKLPLHFSHGMPALCTYEGQSCAALADVLVHGLSQDRVRRVLPRLHAAPAFPKDWYLGIARDAGLFTLEHWSRALARTDRNLGPLLDIITLLSRGVEAAAEVGNMLAPPARALWRQAIRLAPPAAVTFTLKQVRVPDTSDPGNSIVWAPAQHFVTVARPYMRLLGLCSRSWPRREGTDPLLPDHLLARTLINAPSITELDRHHFSALTQSSATEVVLSRARRSSSGSLLTKSPLWPKDLTESVQGRIRVPEHAFSEADRMLARPLEAIEVPLVRTSRQCWRNRYKPLITAHDGNIRQNHPLIDQALERVHSTGSIRRLLRDPLGYVWRHVLGWRSVALSQQPLAIDALAFGELVHEIMRLSVDSLDPNGGLSLASPDDIREAVQSAAVKILASWPLERRVPPHVLWRGTVDEAARRCRHGLLRDHPFQHGTKSWTELPFASAEVRVNAPWRMDAPVLIEGTRLRLTGRIDRMEITADGLSARVSDYKSGKAPAHPDHIIIDGGAELQRTLYAMAVRRLLPQVTRIKSRLVYLDGASAPAELSRDTLDASIATIVTYVNHACTQVMAGHLTPGADTKDAYYENRLAYPADLRAYMARKRVAFRSVQRPLAGLWDRP